MTEEERLALVTPLFMKHQAAGVRAVVARFMNTSSVGEVEVAGISFLRKRLGVDVRRKFQFTN